MLPHAMRTSNAPRTRRLLLGQALLGACLLTGLGSAQAQATYPQKPILMVVLGTLIGGIVVALYLPIFNLGQVF
jgi:type IV pilus assembly protein PilC